MKNSGLLFLVISIMHIPHERNCVKIINDGFVPKTPNSRDCFDFVRACSQMILDEGETLDNLPPDIILQYKCPYYEDGHRMRLMGPPNGSWIVDTTEPVKNCVVQLPDHYRRYGIKCSHSTGQTYNIRSALRPFFEATNCSMRIFLGEVARINVSWYTHWMLTNDHGLKGLTKEISVMEFAEAPYFNHSLDAECKEEQNFDVIPSKNGASDRRPRTDFILIFCGVAMASAVLSF